MSDWETLDELTNQSIHYYELSRECYLKGKLASSRKYMDVSNQLGRYVYDKSKELAEPIAQGIANLIRLTGV